MGIRSANIVRGSCLPNAAVIVSFFVKFDETVLFTVSGECCGHALSRISCCLVVCGDVCVNQEVCLPCLGWVCELHYRRLRKIVSLSIERCHHLIGGKHRLVFLNFIPSPIVVLSEHSDLCHAFVVCTSRCLLADCQTNCTWLLNQTVC